MLIRSCRPCGPKFLGVRRLTGITRRTAGMLVLPIFRESTDGRKPDSPPARRPVRGRTRPLLLHVRGSRSGAKPVTTVTTVRNAGREFRRDSRCRIHAGDDRRADDRPSALILPRPCVAPPATQVEMGLFDTITESIFGKPDPNTWRPLPLSTLFSEGWNEAWVPSPSGSGSAPRQGWINAADGNLYRLSFFTFAQGFNRAPEGNAYLGAYTIFTPLSRRLELITNIPFVLRNNAVTGLPIIEPEPAGGDDVAEPHGIRRYLVHAPRLAARDEGLLTHGRTRGLDPDRQPAPCGENAP